MAAREFENAAQLIAAVGEELGVSGWFPMDQARTDFSRAIWENPQLLAARERETPLRRIGEPDDIGGIAVMLAGPAGAFITGQVIVADGGLTV